MPSTSPPEQGQLVQVRSRSWVVNEIKPSGLPTPAMKLPVAEPQNLLTLSSVEDDGLGEELQVVWEIEPGAKIIERAALPGPTGFDSPEKLDAFLDAVRWGAASTADLKNIQSPFRSGIEIEDYQLDPVVRAIQMPRVNLLIADDVGLGKTIEAGMVALELLIRHRARKMLIIVPSSLQIQWQDQMRDKFGLEFRIVDSELMRELRRKRGIHVNPWSHFPRLITSIDFLKRERPLRLFRETLPAPGEPIYPRKYDLMICDEAHNCAPSGRGKYATDSLRTQALRDLAPHFEHKLFLTATPHNGYRESFSALLELLDNQRFSRGTDPDRKQLEAIMVRRLKTDPTFAKRWDGSTRFPPRVLEPIEVPFHIPFEVRHLVATQRYSIPGLPCLYLAGSLYTCWEEMGRPPLHELQCAALWVKSGKTMKMLNLSNRPARLSLLVTPPGSVSPEPNYISSHIVLWPLVFSSSIKVKHRNAPFKPEYVISQMVLQWVTQNHGFDGLAYFSTHVRAVPQKHPLPACNVVVPAKNVTAAGRCERLCDIFKMTDPFGWQLLSSINVGEGTGGATIPIYDLEFIEGVEEPYYKTEFGMVQTRLNKLVTRTIQQNNAGAATIGDVPAS
jgi:hypothetical protein